MKQLLTLSLILFSFFNSFSQKSEIVFETPEYNFGDIQENKGKVSHKFSFTNNGKESIRILTVKPSCGCTTPNWSKDEIKPGKKGFIIAEYNPKGRPGVFRKSLSVISNDNRRSLIFIKGKVVR
ncbi:MAG: DUF1573 domain-containing protein [Flammeovirgaceae bacterium TMED290]|nr:MAG: DUF1573 domain-containing protein [Flammeovirgaceae bacterium TMED290]|tara:strand:- start:3890 stop:4261 length:372 start_codon:yes stop_codon:yes gene_type:complete